MKSPAIMLYAELGKYTKFSNNLTKAVFVAGYDKSYEIAADYFRANTHAVNYSSMIDAMLCLQHVKKIMTVLGE